MGLMDFIKGELLEIIEWTDDSRDTLSYRFPDQDKQIKRGAQLIVRESQIAQFVYLGQFGDAYPPASSPAVVVALDEETFRTPPFEGSPSVTWTPEIGRVLTAIIDGGAKVVGFDIVFPTSIEQSAVPFGDETLGSRLRGFDRDYLRALALGARAGKVVLGEVQHQADPVGATIGAA